MSSLDQLRDQLADRLGPDRAGPVGHLRLEPVTPVPGVSPAALPAVLVGDRWVLIGPWSPSGQSPGACPECLRRRWIRVRDSAESAVLASSAPIVRAGEWPVLTAFLRDAITLALEAVRETPAGTRATSFVTVLDVHHLAHRTVSVLPDPRCPACSSPTPEKPAGLELVSRPKSTPDTLRASSPHAYPLPTGALLNDVCGAVGAVAAPDLATPTTAPVAGRVSARSDPGSAQLTWSGQQLDYRTSGVVGLLEGLERYAGSQRRAPLDPIVASLGELRRRGLAVLDPRGCGLYADETYDREHDLVRFHDDLEIPWVWAQSLTQRSPVLVARRNAFYGEASTTDAFVNECSSGCASGGSPEEAMLFGLLELIERDAFLLGWYGGLRPAGIRVDTEIGPSALALVDRAGLYGYDVALLDNRVDLDVPVVTAVARRRDAGPGRLVFASAASLDPRQAVSGALTEILTYLPARPGQARARRTELTAMLDDPFQVRQLRDHAELFGLPELADRAGGYLGEGPEQGLGETFAARLTRRPLRGDLTDDLGDLVSDLGRAGWEVLVVDQTTPEQAGFGISTVRMIVPGLLPIDFGWSRQRALRMPRMEDAFDSPRASGLDRGPRRIVPHPFP